MNDRKPPYNLDTERVVLGTMVLFEQSISRVIEIINEQTFYHEKHRRIFAAIDRLVKKREAVGIGGQIYGKRADMIIVDDAVTLSNANDFERQIKWLTQDVRSRLNPTGKLIIIGTRVASVDLYKELRNEDRYPGGLVPLTEVSICS